MNCSEMDKLLSVKSAEIGATVALTDALEKGRITSSEYTQLRYNMMGRSDVFQSLLMPLFYIGIRALQDLLHPLKQRVRALRDRVP